LGAIFGILGSAEPAELTAMGRRLVHRGAGVAVIRPAPGVWLGRVADRGAGDPERAPTRPVVLDGFLDDAAELAVEIGASPGATEEELALELYHGQGARGFARLRGQFALALWDERRSRLVLARDPCGIRSLHVARTGERLAFASEYKALLALADVPARPDRDAIAHVQRTKYAPADASCLLDVRPVPPGSWRAFGEGADLPGADYRELPPTPGVRNGADALHVGAVRGAILDSARRQARSGARLGVSLSAGLDSCLTLGLLRHLEPEREIHTFTSGFAPDDPDLAEAADVARRLRTTHRELVVGRSELASLLPLLVWHLEDPIGRDEMLHYLVVARAAAGRVDVLFTGQFADGLFGGMPRHRIVALRNRLPLGRRAAWQFLDYTQTGRPPGSLLGRLLVAGYFRGRPAAAPDVLGAPGPAPPAPELAAGPEALNEFIRRSFLAVGCPAGSAVDRLDHSVGIPSRSLFYDPAVVRAALAVPSGLKIRAGKQKYVLRLAGRGILDEDLLFRRKGFLRLRHDRDFADLLDELAEELLAPATVRGRGLVDPVGVERLRRRPAGGVYPQEHVYRLWSLFLLEHWCRHFLDRRGAGPEEV
jgi:asparagine synthase (glutamine-hydrolysing)